jgi:integrase
LFPRLALINERHRSSLFQRSCARVGVVGVSLHSYRYAWAERARSCGYPERFAQEALGHNSKAVHRAYARNAQVTVPSLEEYENKRAEKKVIPFPLNRPTAPTSTTPPNQTPATAPPVLAFILPFRSAG